MVSRHSPTVKNVINARTIVRTKGLALVERILNLCEILDGHARGE